MKLHAIRIPPGTEISASKMPCATHKELAVLEELDLLNIWTVVGVKTFLEAYVKQKAPSGVFVLSCCGSVSSATLRFASDPDGTTNNIETRNRYFEVLSMTGTLSQAGTHLHLTLADNTGRTLGGHLVGNLTVQTTMEVALGQPQGVVLGREFDPRTGYSELVVKETGHQVGVVAGIGESSANAGQR